MKNKRISILWIAAAVLVLILAATGFYRVPEGSQAVLLTFGEIEGIKPPGMYWRLPIVQTVQTQSVTNIYTIEYGFRTTEHGSSTTGASYADVPEEGIMLTGDGNIVKVEAIYQVVVQDLPAFFYNVDEPFESMQYAFETILRRNIQNLSLDDALLDKQQIEMQVLPDFQQIIDNYGLGIRVREVRIQNIVVPDDVAPSYEDVNNAMNEKNRKLDEAERYKNEVVPAARAVAYRMLQDAEAYKAEQIAKAEGDVALFNEVFAKYRSAPDITRQRLLIETIESILKNADSKVIVEKGSEGVIKVLPIDIGSSGGTTQSPVQTTAAETTAKEGE